MNIILLTDEEKNTDSTFTLSDSRYWHIKNVLKAKEGDLLQVGLLNGPIGRARILSMTEKQVVMQLVEISPLAAEKTQIDLICALPRPQTLKKVLSTCATMGVRQIYLIRSEKVEKSFFQSPLLQQQNYTRFLIEGLSQGKRTQLPLISIHRFFKPCFAYFSGNFLSPSL